MGEDGQDPEDIDHPVEQGTTGKQNNPLRPFHDPYLARRYDRLSPRPSEGDQETPHGGDRGEQHEVGMSVCGVIIKQPDEEGEIGVSIDHRVEKGPKGSRPPLRAGHRPVQEIKKSGYDNSYPGCYPQPQGQENGGHQGSQQADHCQMVWFDHPLGPPCQFI